MMQSPSAAAEWKAYWTLPVAAALGYASSVIHIYGLSPYIVPISEDFGWDRSTVTMGLTIATMIQALFAVPIGILVDRVGPRALGVIGVMLACAAFALIGFAADGSVWQWYGLWVVMALAVLPVQATIWTAAVATRFEASRGMAFAITLCGASVAQALFPWLGARLIAGHGWHTAMVIQAAIWAVIAVPVITVFFRGARDVKGSVPSAAAKNLAGFGFFEGLKSAVYVRLLLASLLFTFVALALVVNFIPIQTDAGMDPADAGALAVLIGLFAIAGRLSTGMLIDRFRANLVGAAVFVLPMLACLTFLFAGPAGAFLAAALIGLTVGAEVDVIVYLTTRHFGLKAFGALYGGLLIALSLGTALGPWAATRVFDATGDYDAFFWAGIGCMVAAVALLVSLPRPAFGVEEG